MPSNAKPQTCVIRFKVSLTDAHHELFADVSQKRSHLRGRRLIQLAEIGLEVIQQNVSVSGGASTGHTALQETRTRRPNRSRIKDQVPETSLQQGQSGEVGHEENQYHFSSTATSLISDALSGGDELKLDELKL